MTFSSEIERATEAIRVAPLVKSGFWQGVNTSKHPEMATHELLNFTLSVDQSGIDSEDLVSQIKPDLPWADDHFAERISRIPLNPPPSEGWWPHSPKGNDRFKNSAGIFSHTYPERYWPQFASPTGGSPEQLNRFRQSSPGLTGIRFRYGDLDDLICLLNEDPLTRQAYLPVWFPEDLGAPIDQRKPCTLGYHFIHRDGNLHIVYYIRSCDFVRHFRNDIYLTVLLQRWVLSQLRELDSRWMTTIPGSFTMHITSLHLFRNDYYKLFPGGV